MVRGGERMRKCKNENSVGKVEAQGKTREQRGKCNSGNWKERKRERNQKGIRNYESRKGRGEGEKSIQVNQ